MRDGIHPKRWAYLAGLIDGDGSFSIRYDQEAGYQLTLNVYSTSKSLMIWLSEVFGGQFRKLTTKGNRKQKYTWYSTNRQISENVVSYLILKKRQAELSLLFYSLGSERNPSAREELKRDIQRANDYYLPANKQEVEELKANSIEPSKLDWAYLAGLFDAEGSFSIQKRRQISNGSYTSYARISNTDNRAFLWLIPRFGGRFSVTGKKNNRNEGTWTLSGERGLKGRKDREKQLLSFVPYLTAKKHRAILFMDWVQNNHSMTSEQKLDCFLKMRALNKRGISQETNTVNCPNNGQMIESDPGSDVGSESTVMLNS